LVVSLYTVAVETPLRRAVLGFLLIIPGMALSAWHISGDSTIKLGNLLFATIIGAGSWAAGRLVRVRTATAVAQARRADRLATEKAEAVAEERGRIARELHDVVAHCVSVMVVQAGAAQSVLNRDPQRAIEPLEAVQATGRQALAEMSRLVGLLRDDRDRQRLAPQPGLANLDELIAQMRDAGLRVDLVVEGHPTPVPPSVDLSAYRVLQEALTNALKHAGGATTRVRVRYADCGIDIDVIDDGDATSNGSVGGHGLVGMRERINVVGGQLEVGPRPEGGFAVTAHLPIPEAP
jgi:signal transduction histidine kinase